MSEVADIDAALAEMGRQAKADEACSICHASVRPDRRDRHLVGRERLPQVFGGRVTPTATSEPTP